MKKKWPSIRNENLGTVFVFFFHMQEQGYNGQGKNWLMYIPLSKFFLCRCKLV